LEREERRGEERGYIVGCEKWDLPSLVYWNVTKYKE
jgi:hypothetical protein